MATPNITQVLPQSIKAGSQSTTLKVVGTNFPAQAAILWNGAAIATTTVDNNTLSGPIASSSIANPGTVQLKVQNTQTMQESPAVSLVIAPADSTSPLTISLTPLPQGVVNAGYTGTLSVTGGTAPYTWSIGSGQLPAGLTLAPNTGIISGTPITSGSFSFVISVLDSSAQSATATVPLTIGSAAGATPTVLTITSTSLPSGTIGSGYSNSLQASGGTAPYTWSFVSGSLPAGLSMNTSTGLISGTPTASGTATFTAKVTDAGSPAQTKSVTLSLVIAPTTLAIPTSALPSATQSSSYSRSVQATGGTSPYTWSLSSGALPAGLNLAPSSGLVSGTPSASGNFSFGVTVQDAGSPTQTASATITLSIVAAGTPLAISSTTLPAGTPSQAYTASLNATGGTAPYTWSSSALPNGLSLSPATGLLSGTPAASSTTDPTFTVTDSSSPAQTKSVTLSLIVAPVPLAITTSSLSSGTKDTSYSNSLQASGGTTSYTWSITAGSLPAGLSLNGGTGLITGTPSSSGTSNFTVTVTDAGSPAQSKSVALSIAVAAPAPPALTINASLGSGTANTTYSSPMSASGGTPAYTWSITSGSLPAGLTLAATTGIISGTPTVSGTFNFTASVSDNGSPVQTASAATSLVVAASTPPPGPGTTWYIRPDGGSRYSANQPQGQCDGKADTAYPGTGTNQHCAFNDYRYLWDDRSYGNNAWVIAGGDTVIIRGGPWRVGFNQGLSPNDVWCSGGNGNNACINPTIPAGTPTQHTRILGENYASCSTGNATNKSSLTQIFGGYGVWMALNLSGAQYVDVECLDITRHSQCIVHGSPQSPGGCNTSYPVDDYDSSGISTDTNTHDLLLQDIWVHGHTDRGIKGPIGGLVTCNRCEISFNGMSGWDFDDGSGSNNGYGTASLPGALWTLNYTSISWNGCNQEYPIVDDIPAISCYSQSTGGYGDGVGTPPGMCLSANINHSSFNYNTQDGLDLGHIDTGSCTLTINDSQAIGNNGQTFKWGPNENPVVFTNNFALANCRRMTLPMNGAPSSYNTNLSDFCRAGDNLSFNFRQGGTALLANNTIIGYQPTSYDINCWDASCSTSTLIFENNITMGYDNPAMYSSGGQAGGVGGLFFEATIGTVTRSHNIFYGMRSTSFNCPTGFPGEVCTDPLFANEPSGQGANFTELQLDNLNFTPSPSSPVNGAGLSISGVPSLLLDYNGVTRSNPPSIGAAQ